MDTTASQAHRDGTPAVSDGIQTAADGTRYVNCAPTAAGYANIACALIDSVISDATPRRRGAVASQLSGIIDTVRYLTLISPADLAKVQAHIARREGN